MNIIQLTMAGLIVAGAAAYAQDDLMPEEEWSISLGTVNKTYLDYHSALQHRADDVEDASKNYRDGNVDGRGWGIQFNAEKGGGAAFVTYLKTDVEYEYHDPGNGGSHRIESDRRDVYALWQQQAGENQKAVWGWMAGFRYIGLDNKMRIIEGSADRIDTGEINWYMISAGYFGEIHPFGGDYVIAYGSINALVGEVSGMARTGTDSDYDGAINDTYEDEYSVAYGAAGNIGASMALTGWLHLGVEYNRQWLFSFSAVDNDDSVLVFPDNNDALFIENHQGLSGFLKAVW